MIELTEAAVLSRQINQTCLNKRIIKITVNQHPHKFAWFNGDPLCYESMLINQSFKFAKALGGMIEIDCEACHLVFSDGVQLSYLDYVNDNLKHQLQLEFSDHSFFNVSVRMYGGLWCYTDAFDNPYYFMAKNKPSVFSQDFNEYYFAQLMSNNEKLSLKAFLATEQRIPGFGNGLCQDILWQAHLHPKTKLRNISSIQISCLYQSMKQIIDEIVQLGGRDTELDLFGKKGKYLTKMSHIGLSKSCPVCGSIITKENYLGGSIYTCPLCQTNDDAKLK